jgi:hypothetical protein
MPVKMGVNKKSKKVRFDKVACGDGGADGDDTRACCALNLK